ncbi:tetratricopeptide repeat protein [Streptomyces sp. NPDC017529]|uniref:tetratricopeptide repeat protein n=1 Tax=Streptomyces sp. NPDC017529 TaxID=3365000 RepID=UPI0037ADBE74
MTEQHPLVARGEVLVDLGRYDEAAAVLGSRLQEDPADVWALLELTRCHLAAQQPDRAVDVSGRALELAPQDYATLHMRARSLRAAQRMEETDAVLREAIRVDPLRWTAYGTLAEIQPWLPDGDRQEGVRFGLEAVRLAPEEPRAYESLYKAALIAGDQERARQALDTLRRLDPTNSLAVVMQADSAANAPGVKAAAAADLYADALSTLPESQWLRSALDEATYRLLRGTRWLALLCVAAAGVTVDLFPQDGEVPRELPVPLGNRLWTLVPMAALWGFGALLRYRRLRTGVQLNVWSLVRRGRWARIVLGQGAWAMLCALLISQVPWTERTVPQVLFWAGLLPTPATVWFDRRKRR